MLHPDRFNRPISYLRVSVTDRCNLRCTYCMPSEGVSAVSHSEILTYEEIGTVVRAAAELGISKVRLTGGEPLARLGLVDLVRIVNAVLGIDDLSMTTNGTLLAPVAEELKEAGLDRVNISLDTLDPEKYRRITRRGDLEDALVGIETAIDARLTPLKINTVLLRGVNDGEIVELARTSVERGWNIRFLELMPVGPAGNDSVSSGFMAKEAREAIEAALGPLEPDRKLQGSGPALYYRLPGAPGTIGFISPITEHFCYQCNRLRLTSDGKLRPCLLSDHEVDLRGPLRRGAAMEEIQRLLIKAIKEKPAGHNLCDEDGPEERIMSQIGG
jgi:cyclic pyranopterin phosphate synthase